MFAGIVPLPSTLIEAPDRVEVTEKLGLAIRVTLPPVLWLPGTLALTALAVSRVMFPFGEAGLIVMLFYPLPDVI